MSMVSRTRLELLLAFTRHRIRARYRGAALGVAWALLRPILTTLILALVATFFQLQVPYAVPTSAFILVGLVPWLFTAGTISTSCTVLVYEGNVIKKVYFPRQILPLAVTFAEGTHLLIAGAVLLPLLFSVCGFLPDHWIAVLPLVVVVHVLLVYGLSLIVALGNVYFRDVAAMLEAGLMAWFYVTPIFYPVSLVREALSGTGASWPFMLYMANPLAAITYGYRQALLHGAGFLTESVQAELSQKEFSMALAWAACVAIALAVTGEALCRRHGRRIADFL